MGTRAYWMTSKWRASVVDADGERGPWVHADLLSDLRDDFGGEALVIIERVLPARRRQSSGVDYEPYGTLVFGRMNRSK